MKTIHQLQPPYYLQLFSYHDCVEGNEVLLATDEPNNLLRKRIQEQKEQKPVSKLCVQSFIEFRERFMSDESESDQVGLAFRGQARRWPLQTKLKRFWEEIDESPCEAVVETANLRTPCCWNVDLLNNLVERYLDQGCKVLRPPKDQLWAILQHYGAPTPLLDWTLSLNVALYFAFAVCPAKEQFHAYVHIADIGKIHRMNYQEGLTIPKLRGLDYTKIENTWTFVWPSQFGDIRFATQQGLFAYQNFKHPDDMIPLDDYLRAKGNPGTLLSVGIPVSERQQVMFYLEERGITHDALFPSWENICTDAMSNYRNYLMFPEWQRECALAPSAFSAIQPGAPKSLNGET